MKILLMHNFYQNKGGEDVVFESEKLLLKSYGHDVSLYVVNNSLIDGLKSKIKTFLTVSYSEAVRKKLTTVLKESNPDIVHIHNFFPLLSPSIFDACFDCGIPVIQTLHNYRTICPGGLLLRDGKVCEKCIEGSAYQAVRHRCYKKSFFGTYSVSRMVDKSRNNGTWKNKVTKFIALTEFAKKKFIQAGFPESKLTVKSNFIFDLGDYSKDKQVHSSGALFVGRLSQEKGILTLINAWQKLEVNLTVIGTGPLENIIQASKNSYINVLGEQEQKLVRLEMRKATFLVVPSEWYEGFPMVLVEAFSQGLPIIVSGLGSLAEIVQDGFNGLHFEHGNANDLAEKVRWMVEHPDMCKKMGKNARTSYLEKYTPNKNYDELISLYKLAIKENDDKKN